MASSYSCSSSDDESSSPSSSPFSSPPPNRFDIDAISFSSDEEDEVDFFKDKDGNGNKRSAYDDDEEILTRKRIRIRQKSKSPPQIGFRTPEKNKENQTTRLRTPSASPRSDYDDYEDSIDASIPLVIKSPQRPKNTALLPESPTGNDHDNTELYAEDFLQYGKPQGPVALKLDASSLSDSRYRYDPLHRHEDFLRRCQHWFNELRMNEKYRCEELPWALAFLYRAMSIKSSKNVPEKFNNMATGWYHIMSNEELHHEASFTEAVLVKNFNLSYTYVSNFPADTIYCPHTDADGTVTIRMKSRSEFCNPYKNAKVATRDWEGELSRIINWKPKPKGKKGTDSDKDDRETCAPDIKKYVCVDIASIWISSMSRKTAESVVFHPADAMGNLRPGLCLDPVKYLNTWCGLYYSTKRVNAEWKDASKNMKRALSSNPTPTEHLTAEEKKLLEGQYEPDKILDHVKHVWCGAAEGDNQQAMQEFTVRYLASMLQRPERKLSSALCVRGLQGIGKNCVTDIMGACLGASYVAPLNSQGDLTSHFNAHVTEKLLVILDENQASNSKNEDPKLKTLITGSVLMATKKGIDTAKEQNYFNVIIFSNDNVLINIEPSARRYMMLNADNGLPWLTARAKAINELNRKLGRLSYKPNFDALPRPDIFEIYHTYLRTGFFTDGNSSDTPDGPLVVLFADMLYRYQLPADFCAMNPPKTKLFQYHAETSFGPFKSWWHSCLQRRSLFSDGPIVWENGVTEGGYHKTVIWQEYTAFCSANKCASSEIKSEESFWKEFYEFFKQDKGLYETYQPRIRTRDHTGKVITVQPRLIKFAPVEKHIEYWKKVTGVVPEPSADDVDDYNTTIDANGYMMTPVRPSDKQVELDTILAQIVALNERVRQLRDK
jgi:hypothetical protein